MAAPTPTHEFAAVAPPRPSRRGRHAGQRLNLSLRIRTSSRSPSGAAPTPTTGSSRRYRGFVRLKASSYFLLGGDSEDLIQEGLLGLYKAIRDFRTDRESSFRNFAELCITRQIITAVKTASRNKHAPLNQYVSFAQSPAGAGDSRDHARGDAARARAARSRPSG